MKTGVVWLRRDLRLHDHPALSAALAACDKVHILFIFDPVVLEPLRDQPSDRRLSFIIDALLDINARLMQYQTSLHIQYGHATEIIPAFVKTHQVNTLYFNRDYTPYTRKRDAAVQAAVSCAVQSYADQLHHEPDVILKPDKTPYKVFTPYARAWKKAYRPQSDYPVALSKLRPQTVINHTRASVHDLIQFTPCTSDWPGGFTAGLSRLALFYDKISEYAITRDFPLQGGTSQLGVYSRHGCISVRDMLKLAYASDEAGHATWLNELIWREFYYMILYQYSYALDQPFNKKYTDLDYPGLDAHFEAWTAGQTGFPIVDAAMRCLNQTGWMHNRLRMITASFLCKLLLVDWRKGERYFAKHLIDYDCASNNGGWQWASGTGCDAAPYFRIFNPYAQSKRYDPDGNFIRHYCPELAQATNRHQPLPVGGYPRPIIDYSTQRQRSLAVYRV